MLVIYQSSFSCNIGKLPDNTIIAKSCLLTTTTEAVGKLIVQPDSFKILEANWQIFRSPGNSLYGNQSVPELHGLEAYFNIGAELRRAVGDAGNGLAQILLAECVKGVIQAETFLYTERGYQSASAYEAYWDNMYHNACRYYSNLDRVTQTWFGHVGEHSRQDFFFQRNKHIVVYRLNGGSTMITGSFMDSFHEINVCLTLDGQKVIKNYHGQFLRAPDQVCFENTSHLNALIGTNFRKLSKRDIGQQIGGSQGCSHLVDLVYDMVIASSCT